MIMAEVASACCLQGKNNREKVRQQFVTLHLPAVCKVKTTVAVGENFVFELHLPAVCKVKTTTSFF